MQFLKAEVHFYNYTYLSNFLLGFVLIIAGVLWTNMYAKKALFISVVSITMTFVVYWALLSYQKSTWTNPLNATRSLITHAINPILGFVALSLIRKEIIVTKITFTIPVLISTVYTIFAMILFFDYIWQNNSRQRCSCLWIFRL
nr:hypothetical protein [Mycoplasmopsis bovis]